MIVGWSIEVGARVGVAGKIGERMKEEPWAIFLHHGVQFGVTLQPPFLSGMRETTFGDARFYRTTARCTFSLLEAIVTRLYLS